MPTRLVWLDAARGLCVLAVVVMHVTTWFALPDNIEAYFEPLRMPVLFTLSGHLVASRRGGGLGLRKNRVRVLGLVYLYVTWLIIYFVCSRMSAVEFPGRVDSVKSLAVQFFLPTYSTLWFLYALATYTALLFALRRVPSLFILVPLAGVTIGAGLLPDEFDDRMWVHVLAYAFFFALGALHPGPLSWLARDPFAMKFGFAAGLLTVLVLAGLLPPVRELPLLDGTAHLAQSLAAVALGVTAAVQLCRIRMLGVVLAAFGRRTLPVYLLHPLLIMLVAEVLHVSTMRTVTLDTSPFVGVVVAVALSAVCLGIYAAFRLTPLRVLFAYPESWFDGALLGMFGVQQRLKELIRMLSGPELRLRPHSAPVSPHACDLFLTTLVHSMP